MTKTSDRYIVQVWKWNRWINTIWTRQGLPVPLKSAEKALAEAKNWFPKNIFRLRKVKAKVKKNVTK